MQMIESTQTFRVSVGQGGPTSKSISIQAIRDTGQRRFSGVKATSSRVTQSLSTAITGRVEAIYSDERARPAAFETVQLQVRRDVWTDVKEVKARSDGSFRIDFTPSKTAEYRLVSRKDYSSTVVITVVPPTPKEIVVGWPQSLYSWSSFRLQAAVRDTTGRWWRSSVRLIFQYRASRYSSWRNLDYDNSTKTSYAILIAGYQGDGYYRVYAPELNLANEISYA